jgi:CheY-like chemotaxis protein
MAPKNILVVEDDEDTRMDLSDQLDKAGYKVFLASEGTGAIHLVLENPEIYTIVSDVRMPVFGGDYWLSFLEQFCAPRYRIILATARAMSQVPKGMILLRKPYSFSELESTLAKL